MSDQTQYEDEQDETESRKVDPVRAQLRRLEAENKTLREQSTASENDKRKLAFLENGVDVTSPVGKMFAQAYNGELTAEAILAVATELNLVTPQTDPLAEDKAALGRIAGAGKAGSTSVVRADLNTRIAGAKNRQELDAVMAQHDAEQNL